MVRRSGQRGVPVIAVDDQIIVGFNRPLLEQALSRKRSELGVSVADAAKLKRKYGLSVDSGALVGLVKPGSAASRAGLKAGDVIVEIAGKPIRDAQDVTNATAQLHVKGEVSITWIRGSQTMSGTTRL